jgi:hypothetical protein
MDMDYTKTLERLYQLFNTCPDPNRKQTADGWSIKEVLGHLLDSLSNNHQRLSRYVAQGDLAFPAYDQDVFVQRANYGAFSFGDLLSLWYLYNRLFLHMIASIPSEDLGSTITVGDRPTLTIEQLIEGYFAHMEVHERQVRRIIHS